MKHAVSPTRRKVPALLSFLAAITLLMACSTDPSPVASLTEPDASSEEGVLSSSSPDPAGSDDSETSFESASFDFEGDYPSQSGEAFEGNFIDVSALTGSYMIEEAGTYVLSGQNDDLSIEVSSSDDIVVVLNGVSLKSQGETGPLYVTNAGSFTIHVASATKNFLEDSAANLLDGVINVKKTDFNVEGEGYLYVASNGLAASESGKGLHAAKALSIEDSHIQVTGAEDHALNGKDGVLVKGAALLLEASGDGLHSKEGAISLEDVRLSYAGSADAVDAASGVSTKDSDVLAETEGTYILYESANDADGTLYEDSKYILQNGEYVKISEDEMARYSERYYLESSCKGLKSDADIEISGGVFTLLTADDAVNSDASITVHSGTFHIKTKDQGFNAGTSLTIGDEGAYSPDLLIDVQTSYEGLQGAEVLLRNGYIYINASDDGVNATSDLSAASVSLTVSGAPKIHVFAEGDAFDSNGDLSLLGGEIALFATSKKEDSALDYDGDFALSGASLIAVSIGGGMEEDYSGAAEYLLNASYSGSFDEGTSLSISGAGVLLSALLPASYRSIKVLFASPLFAKGTTYKVVQGGTLSTAYMDKVHFGTDPSLLTGGTGLSEFSFASFVTTIGGGQGGGGHGPGGR